LIYPRSQCYSPASRPSPTLTYIEPRTRQFAKPYFRDWKLLRHHEGKTFLCPPRLFKSSLSLYVPNLHGVTLASPRKPVDTTPVILNRISVIAIWSSLWGENQAATFISRRANPGLYELLAAGGKDIAQVVRINVETNWLKALLIRIFMWSLRRKMERDDWGRYFLLRKGLTDEIRGAIAAPNLNVGYVYLVDWDGRIRWAGCGNAADGETDALNSGVGRLLEQWTLRKGGVHVLKGAVPVSVTEEAPTKSS
jgi:ATPase complex subunit ATP10